MIININGVVVTQPAANARRPIVLQPSRKKPYHFVTKKQEIPTKMIDTFKGQ